MDDEYKTTIEIPFSSERIARLAYDVLRVDKEPKRGGVTKTLQVQDCILKAELSAKLAKQLRVAVNGFFEKLDLVAGTIELLGPPVSETYSFY